MGDGESTVLVLGASGFLGSHVVKALLAEGRKVRTFVRPTSDTSSIDHLDIERYLGDVQLLVARPGNRRDPLLPPIAAGERGDA